MKKFSIHWQLAIAIGAGILFGILAANWGLKEFTLHWIKPFGTIFLNSLQMIAIPLIATSLITGICELKNISRLTQLGGRTIGFYLLTTTIAIVIGLMVVNTLKPGYLMTPEARTELSETFLAASETRAENAKQKIATTPLAPLIDLVPINLFMALSDNTSTLQVIFFVLLFAIGILLAPKSQRQPVEDFFTGLHVILLRVIDIIMRFAPIGVFALLASLVVEVPNCSVLMALLGYTGCVIAGLAILIFVFYPILSWLVGGKTYRSFLNAMAPVQLLAFSTSSSAATLPLTMERVEQELGVQKQISSFVLPIGATVNMDGTSLYQGVAAVFIAQCFGMNLGLPDQIGIVLTALMASIGTAAVPGAGIIMLIIVLNQAGIPETGLALVFAVDRPLDMLRTVANVTGDAAVSIFVEATAGFEEARQML